nr:MAG TPA: hypothetical protein [Caudoviricetes sp.]
MKGTDKRPNVSRRIPNSPNPTLKRTIMLTPMRPNQTNHPLPPKGQGATSILQDHSGQRHRRVLTPTTRLRRANLNSHRLRPRLNVTQNIHKPLNLSNHRLRRSAISLSVIINHRDGPANLNLTSVRVNHVILSDHNILDLNRLATQFLERSSRILSSEESLLTSKVVRERGVNNSHDRFLSCMARFHFRVLVLPVQPGIY